MESFTRNRDGRARNSNTRVLSLPEIYRQQATKVFNKLRDVESHTGGKLSLVAQYLAKRADLIAAQEEKLQLEQMLKPIPTKIPVQLDELQPVQHANFMDQLKEKLHQDFTVVFPFPRPTICFKTIPAKTTRTILETKIPTGFMGFLEFFAIVHPFVSDFEMLFKVDGTVIQTYTYSVASIDQPLKFDPPWVCNASVSLVATNNTSKEYKCGVLFDGQLRKAINQEEWQVVDGKLQRATRQFMDQFKLE